VSPSADGVVWHVSSSRVLRAFADGAASNAVPMIVVDRQGRMASGQAVNSVIAGRQLWGAVSLALVAEFVSYAQ